MSEIQLESSSILRPGLTVLAAIGTLVLAMTPPVDAAWMAGRADDGSGQTYLSVFNDSENRQRIEFNCTEAGQAFMAITWDAAEAKAQADDDLTLRFDVGGSHRFAAPARLRPLEHGWAAAELDAPELIGPLTEALSGAGEPLKVEVVQQNAAVLKSQFDMIDAASKIALYRTYCRFIES